MERDVLSAAYVRRALQRAGRRDAHVAAAVEVYGQPDLRRRPPGFTTLLRIIVGQQVSTRAATTIHGRLMTALGGEDPARLLRLRATTLQKTGLSRAKVDYVRALAFAIQRGELDLPALSQQDDAAVIANLTAVKGLGLWSAQIYLMFCLGRPDVWPRGDLGVLSGLQKIKELAARPDARGGEDFAAPFRPHRSALSLMCWHVINNPPLTPSPSPSPSPNQDSP